MALQTLSRSSWSYSLKVKPSPMAFLGPLLPWRSCLSLAWLGSRVVPTNILPDLVFHVLLQEQPYGMSVVKKCGWVFHSVPIPQLPCWWRSHPLSQLTKSSLDRATSYPASSRRQLFRRQDTSAEFHFYSYTDWPSRSEWNPIAKPGRLRRPTPSLSPTALLFVPHPLATLTHFLFSHMPRSLLLQGLCTSCSLA